MYIDSLEIKYKVKLRHNSNYWDKVLVGIIYRMFIGGGLVLLAHRYEMVTTDFEKMVSSTIHLQRTHSIRALTHFRL
ncbi:hypothetical protein AXF17_04035 [Mogibacterium pumilum]|uniref:Uncharacterized protein n=1 Tax=Mogibacterium pumilum TaxID=86332 RepID=A0A223ARV8_9FIRM|nr:hypothetical protein AXF17_04035 [Mogibacterium pumilum]